VEAHLRKKCETTEYTTRQRVECYERTKKRGPPPERSLVHPLSPDRPITYSPHRTKGTSDHIPHRVALTAATDASDGRVFFPWVFPPHQQLNSEP